MKIAIIIVLTLFSLTACYSARVDGPGYDVEVKSDSHDGYHKDNSRFCPPGQAKKGRC